MNRKQVFVLAALTGASAVALAQSGTSSVTVYGILDAGVQHVSGYATRGVSTAVISGIMDGSRLGFRGTEDLGGGYRALFTIESRLEADTGLTSNRPPSGSQLPDRLSQAALLGLPAALQPAVSGVAAQIGSTVGVNLAGGFWDRQSYVGLVTPVGAVLAGRQYTPAYEASATFDATNTQSSLSAGQVGSLPSSIDIRLSNTLQYRIALGGLTAALAYAFGESNTAGSKANRFYGGLALYRADNFSVGAAYNERNNEVGQKSLRSTVVGATLKLGPGRLSGMVVQIKDDNPTGLSGIGASLTPAVGPTTAGLVQAAFVNGLKQDARLINVGYKLDLGVHSVTAAYSLYDDRRAGDNDTASYGVVYTYGFSKRTDLNFVVTHFDNKRLAQAAPGQAGFLGGVTRSAGVDSDSVAIGLRHRF